jgi:hypothetical protein
VADPVSHRATGTPEEIEAFWRAQKRIIAAQEAPTGALVPLIIGLEVDRARQVVAAEAARAGVSLTLRTVEPGTPLTAEGCYGRITATVRDGIIADAGAW